METKKFLLTTFPNKKSILDKAYNKHINCVLQSLDDEKESRWEIYGLIINELVKENKIDYIEEIKYRLTDSEDPNYVMLDIIDREIDNLDGLVLFLRKRIEEFIDDDFFNRFLI
jgi:hypothetical protein